MDEYKYKEQVNGTNIKEKMLRVLLTMPIMCDYFMGVEESNGDFRYCLS